MHHPKSNDYWIGGEEVESIEKLMDDCLEDSVFYDDEKMSEYLSVQMDGLATEFSTVMTVWNYKRILGQFHREGHHDLAIFKSLNECCARDVAYLSAKTVY